MRLTVELELGAGIESAAEAGPSIQASLLTHAPSMLDPLRAGDRGPVLSPHGEEVGTWAVA